MGSENLRLIDQTFKPGVVASVTLDGLHVDPSKRSLAEEALRFARQFSSSDALREWTLHQANLFDVAFFQGLGIEIERDSGYRFSERLAMAAFLLLRAERATGARPMTPMDDFLLYHGYGLW